jgi:hypothetical protein
MTYKTVGSRAAPRALYAVCVNGTMGVEAEADEGAHAGVVVPAATVST